MSAGICFRFLTFGHILYDIDLKVLMYNYTQMKLEGLQTASIESKKFIHWFSEVKASTSYVLSAKGINSFPFFFYFCPLFTRHLNAKLNCEQENKNQYICEASSALLQKCFSFSLSHDI